MIGRVIRAVTGVTVLGLLSGCIIVAKGGDWPRSPRLTAVEAESMAEIPTGGVPTIREKYAPELARLEPGMSVQAFKDIFKDAAFVEQRSRDGATLDAYSLSFRQRYRHRWDGHYYAWTQADEVWFYFKDGKFVKWGEPGQWP